MEEVRIKFPKGKDCKGSERKQKTKGQLQNLKPSVMLQRPEVPNSESSSEDENVDVASPPPIDVLDT